MLTRVKARIFKQKMLISTKHPLRIALLASSVPQEPTSYTQGSKSVEWRQAMGIEFDAFVKQGTWTLVPYNLVFHLVGCKWVYKVKQRADGTMDRFKARLVAKGYNQIHAIDYRETFSPVVKPTTVRVILAIAVHFGWPIRQMDVYNAFLHGVLDEGVYMSQPLGFVDPTKPTHVCCLHKAIYGLK